MNSLGQLHYSNVKVILLWDKLPYLVQRVLKKMLSSSDDFFLYIKSMEIDRSRRGNQNLTSTNVLVIQLLELSLPVTYVMGIRSWPGSPL